MIYCFTCPACGTYREIERMMADRNLPVECACGVSMERVYTVPDIVGETCAGSHWTPWYDETLGCYVDSKRTQQEALKRQGLKIAEPNPDLAEARYIRKHASGKNDKEARRAVQQHAASVKRKKNRQRIHEAVEAAKKTLKF